jgi:hypothetical protein
MGVARAKHLVHGIFWKMASLPAIYSIQVEKREYNGVGYVLYTDLLGMT